MMPDNPLLIFAKATSTVLKRLPNLLLFIVLTILFLTALVAVPAVTIPGNDFFFQLSILTTPDLLILISLSSLIALSVVFHLFLIRQKIPLSGPRPVTQTGTSFASGLVASIFTTASCSACVSTLFGFLGFGAVLFLIQYRIYIITAAIALSAISVYYLAKKVTGVCLECK